MNRSQSVSVSGIKKNVFQPTAFNVNCTWLRAHFKVVIYFMPFIAIQNDSFFLKKCPTKINQYCFDFHGLFYVNTDGTLFAPKKKISCQFKLVDDSSFNTFFHTRTNGSTFMPAQLIVCHLE